MKTLAERFASERAAHGQTYEAVAKLVRPDLSKQAIMKIEKGETLNPSATIIEAVCNAWGINAAWLLEGKLPRERRTVERPAVPSYFRADVFEKDVAVLQAAVRSMVKAISENIPAVSRDFARHLKKQADELQFDTDKKLLGNLFGIAAQDRNTEEGDGQPSFPRGSRGSKRQ